MRLCFFLARSTGFRLTVGYEFVHSSGSSVFRDYVAVCSSHMDSNDKIAERLIVLCLLFKISLKMSSFPGVTCVLQLRGPHQSEKKLTRSELVSACDLGACNSMLPSIEFYMNDNSVQTRCPTPHVPHPTLSHNGHWADAGQIVHPFL